MDDLRAPLGEVSLTDVNPDDEEKEHTESSLPSNQARDSDHGQVAQTLSFKRRCLPWLVFPGSIGLVLFLWFTRPQKAPPLPTTTAFPTAPPAIGFLSTCIGGDQHGWPVFHTKQQLEASKWANYFRKIYGEVPGSGYPLCMSTFKYLYGDIAQEVGIAMPREAIECPEDDGDLFFAGEGPETPEGSLFIWNNNVASPANTSIPANTWVEFTHGIFKDDGNATWLYFLPGTGVWFNVGNTKVYHDHREAVDDLLGPGKCIFGQECVPWFPQLYEAAKEHGFDSLQFTWHRDMPCGATALEIVDLGGPGSTACGSNSYRAGWRASAECECLEDRGPFVNCKGYMSDR